MKQLALYATFLLLVLAACTDGERMRQQLNDLQAYNQADSLMTNDSLALALCDYFDSHGTPNEQMLAHYLLGRTYTDLGEVPMAIECYQHAIEKADTTKADCDLNILYAVYGQMSVLYHKQYLPNKELAVLKAAEGIAWKDKDTIAALKSYELRVRPYFLKNDTDSVVLIAKNTFFKYRQYGQICMSSSALSVLISIFLDRNQLEEASKWMMLYENNSKDFDSIGNIRKGREIYNYDKGRYELGIGNSQTATLYFRKTLDAGYLEAGYKGLLSVYHQENKPDSICKYALLFAQANDDSYSEVAQEVVALSDAMYNYTRIQYEANEQSRRVERIQYTAVILVFLFLGLLFLIISYSKKLERKRLQHITDLVNKKNQLEAILSEKEKEMQTSINEKTQLMSEISDLNKKIEQISKENREEAFYDTAIYREFCRIKDNRPKINPPDSIQWGQFQKAFKDYFPNYYIFIHQNHLLTKDHLAICMLIRIHFKESDIAFFLNVDGQRIDRLKSQINKKLFDDASSRALRDNLKEHF